MKDHPALSVLCRFVSGETSPAENRAVVYHLIRGCEPCQAQIAKAASANPSEDEYELPIRRATHAVLRLGPEAPKIKAATRKLHQRIVAKGLAAVSFKNVPDFAIVEALLQRAQELRYEDPQEMVLCSFLAVYRARCMKDHMPQQQADLHTRALIEYANALRVAGRLSEVESQLDLAEEWFVAGNQDRAVWLRLQDIRASLYGSQQHYDSAINLLEEVIQGRLGLGDRSGAARALVGKGSFTGHAGRLDEALTQLNAALALIDSSREPELAALARHNYIDFMVDAGRYAEALEIWSTHGKEMLTLGGRVDRWKLLSLEGRIRRGLGEFDLAEDLFREARRGFLAAGVKKFGALSSLELATVVLRQSRARYREAVTLAMEALQVFTELQIKPQVLEALNVLANAIRQGLVTATLLQTVTDFLHKAEHDRRARYQPRFE